VSTWLTYQILIKLIRTDTTLDLSQKAEKGMSYNSGVASLLQDAGESSAQNMVLVGLSERLQLVLHRSAPLSVILRLKTAYGLTG
jgi:hypothetical protein